MQRFARELTAGEVVRVGHETRATGAHTVHTIAELDSARLLQRLTRPASQARVGNCVTVNSP